MNDNDPVNNLISRPDHLVTALEVQRALETYDKQGIDALDQSVAQVFADRKNVRFARAIDQRIEPIKKELLESFGLGLKHELQNVMETNNIGDRWELKLAYEESWTKAYAGWGLYPRMRAHAKNAPYLWACVQRTANRMNYGISRSEDQSIYPVSWDLPEVAELQSHLKKNGLRGGAWWLGYKALYDFRKDEFYLRAFSRLDELVMEAVNTFWRLFDETCEMMEEANQAIKKSVS